MEIRKNMSKIVVILLLVIIIIELLFCIYFGYRMNINYLGYHEDRIKYMHEGGDVKHESWDRFR